MTEEQLTYLINSIRKGYNGRLPDIVDERLEEAIEALRDGSIIDATIELRGALDDYTGGDDVMLDLANVYVSARLMEDADE